MNGREMRYVDRVFANLLRMRPELPSRRLGCVERERRVLALWDLRQFPLGFGRLRRVPDEDDARAFDRRPATQPRRAVDRLGVGNLHVVARPVEPPAVERAGHAVLDDRAAHRDVGAEVRAVGIEHIGGAGVAAVADQPPAEVVQTDDLPGVDLSAVGDLEPALGVGVERKSLLDVTHHGVTARLSR